MHFLVDFRSRLYVLINKHMHIDRTRINVSGVLASFVLYNTLQDSTDSWMQVGW